MAASKKDPSNTVSIRDDDPKLDVELVAPKETVMIPVEELEALAKESEEKVKTLPPTIMSLTPGRPVLGDSKLGPGNYLMEWDGKNPWVLVTQKLTGVKVIVPFANILNMRVA